MVSDIWRFLDTNMTITKTAFEFQLDVDIFDSATTHRIYKNRSFPDWFFRIAQCATETAWEIIIYQSWEDMAL